MSTTPLVPSLARSNALTCQTDQVDEWQALVSRLVLPMRAEIKPPVQLNAVSNRFHGQLRMGQFGPSAWLEVDATAQWLHREPQVDDRSAAQWLFVSTMTRGHGWLNANGERKRVDTGQTVFVDAAQAYSLEFDADFAFVSAMLPRADLLAYQPHSPQAHACRVGQPVGAALHAFLQSLSTQDGSAEGSLPSSSRRLYDHFVGLMLSAIEPIALSAPDNQLTASDLLITRIQSALLASLAQPGLNSTWVAQQFGLSTRRVQRLFNAQQTTVAKWLLAQRLQRCAEDLADPAQAERAIGDIAQSWGFSDLSYFSRAFVRHYGQQPSQYRQQRAAICPD